VTRGIYNLSEEDVFTYGVIFLFISLAYFRLGIADESWASFNRAAEIIRRKEPQFLIPGVGTYLYNFAWRELWSVAACLSWRRSKTISPRTIFTYLGSLKTVLVILGVRIT
jgi:hypothetical protein